MKSSRCAQLSWLALASLLLSTCRDSRSSGGVGVGVTAHDVYEAPPVGTDEEGARKGADLEGKWGFEVRISPHSPPLLYLPIPFFGLWLWLWLSLSLSGQANGLFFGS